MDDEPLELRLLRQKLAARAEREAKAAAKLSLQAQRQAASERRLALREAELAYKAEKLRASIANRRSAKDKMDDELYAKTQEYQAGLTTGVLSGAEILARNAAKAAEIKRKAQEAKDRDYAEWLAAQTPEDIERARRREEGQ